MDFDVLVIGSGPAGEGTAMACVKRGKRVAMVEGQPAVGGNCTHKGTIPSKALRHAVKQLVRFNTNPLFREIGDARVISFPKVLDSASQVIRKQVDMHARHFSRNRIRLLRGTAYLLDQHHVQVTFADGACETFSSESIVIATGSRPYRPDDIDFTHPRVYDSDTILEMRHT